MAPVAGKKQDTRILVVEDDETLCKMIGKMLAPLGEVRMAGDGVEALRLVRGGYAPDVVVTDLMMPGMDGLALAQRLKADPRTHRVPLIMLTAKDRPADMIDGINAGARHYLTKPFKHEDLVNKVKRILGIK